jgi:hypothetical protein
MLIDRLLGDPVQVAQTLGREISECTGGRIQELRVEAMGNRVAVHGTTQWYYVKQLAIQAALGYLGDRDSIQLEIAIEIVAGNRGAERGKGQRPESGDQKPEIR